MSGHTVARLSDYIVVLRGGVSGGLSKETHWSVAEEEGYSDCACHRVRGGGELVPGNLIFIRPVLSRVFTSASSPGNLCIM